MAKHYLWLLSIGTYFFWTPSFSQSTRHSSAAIIGKQQLGKPALGFRTDAAGCDTANFPVPANWSVVYYTTGTNGSNGFVSGINAFGDLQKANFFNVSSSANTYLTRVWVGFGKASGSDTTRKLPVKIYDGTLGTPGSLLGSATTTLGVAGKDALAGNYTEIKFSPAITLPASKKFFVSVDLSNLSWLKSPKDSVFIYSNRNNESVNSAWEQWDDATWHAFSDADAWMLNVSLLIHPFVSTNPTCTLTSLPVTLINFKGNRNGSFNVLSWSAETEQNNKGFEIQRSADGDNFSTIAFVPSKAANGNSTSLLPYQFTDENPLDGNVYYRLKQLDTDGKATLSSVVFIKGINSGKLVMSGIYPNPANVNLNIVLDASSTQKVMVIITDLAGKVVMQHDASVTTGNNNLALNVGRLSSGSYMIKAVCSNGCETSVGKFVKE